MSGYIGTQPVPQATQTRDSFTATSGQTSFATGGYTPNFLDVYLNGVKLAAADYTATNGSDVVLASGAATGDILEVVAYTAFDTANVTGATNFTVTGAFTSQGIDDNGNATALTIDSSESVLIGETSDFIATTTTATGLALTQDGRFTLSRSAGTPMNVNKIGADGGLIDFWKTGAYVGSIGVNNSDNFTVQGNSGHSGIEFGTNAIYPHKNSANVDNTIDLGEGSLRWKDLYLSGGIYLGGAGAANKLDDYEEGTWTPVGATGFPVSLSSINASYTKVGTLVSVRANFIARNDGTTLYISGLPFTASNNCAASISVSDGTSVTGERITASGFRCFIASTIGSNVAYYLEATYETNS